VDKQEELVCLVTVLSPPFIYRCDLFVQRRVLDLVELNSTHCGSWQHSIDVLHEADSAADCASASTSTASCESTIFLMRVTGNCPIAAVRCD